MTAPVAPPAKRYPASPITPHGAYYFLKGIRPRVELRAYDGSVTFDLMGGGAIPDRYAAPECVRVTGPMKGLIAPWKKIKQQSATEDGAILLDAVGEPLEVEIPVRAEARDGVRLREVVRDLFASIDKIDTARLSWWTQEMGFWWADLRHSQIPTDPYAIGGHRKTFDTKLVMESDLHCWRSYDYVDEFRFAYKAMEDLFDGDTTERRDCGPDWPVHTQGRGGGYPYIAKGQLRFRDDPNRLFFTEGQDVVIGPRRGFATETNNQVVEIQFGSLLEFGGREDIWVRMGRNADGRWNGFGTRIRIGGATVVLSAFNNFHETPLKTWQSLPPLRSEKWWVEAGDEDDERVFRIKRGAGGPLATMRFSDDDAVTPLGDAFKGVGVGMHAGGALFTQGSPASLMRVSAGDSDVAQQSGHIEMLNIGDQPMFPRYTLHGPGTFEIASGPGSQNMVKFGPLLPNQRVQLRSDGRKRAVVDLTSVPPTAGELLEYRDALKDLESFAPIGNIGPTLESNASMFGVVPPQGNLHRLLEGRFTRPIPKKSPGRGAVPHHIAVSISGGNSDSRIVAAGTPLRKYPQ